MKKWTMLLLTITLVLGMYGNVFAHGRTVWEPLTGNPVITGGGLTATCSSNNEVIASNYKTSGQWYWEIEAMSVNYLHVGIISSDYKSLNIRMTEQYTLTYRNDGYYVPYSDPILTGLPSFQIGDIIGVAMDADTGSVDFYINGILAYSDTFPLSDRMAPTILGNLGVAQSANFGLSPFKYPVPEGYLPYDYESMDKLYVLLEPGEDCQLSLAHDLSVNSGYLWFSMDQAVAVVDSNGMITAVDEGETYVICESADGTYSDFVPVKVRQGNSEKRLAVHLETVGDSEKLWLSDTDPVTWNSLGATVADVDSNGVVTATGRGLTVIEGTVNGKTYHIYVRVKSL